MTGSRQGFHPQTLSVPLDNGHHHFVHQIAVNVVNHVGIQHQIISHVGAQVVNVIHIASHVA